MRKLRYFLTFLVASLTLVSCESFFDKQPEGPGQVIEEDAIKTVNDLQSLLLSVYDVNANTYGGQIQNLSELLGDNNNTPVSQDDYTQVYNRGTDFFNGTISNVFADAYRGIYRSNTLIVKVDEISGVSTEDYNRIKGDAFFQRALGHFYLVRLFAQPYGFTPDNSHLGISIRTTPAQNPLPRNTVGEVYNQIVSDLIQAETLLPESNGIYANKDAAKALLAKVYLQMMNYTDAEAKASEVINSSNGYMLDNLNRFEHGSSSERIFTFVSTPSNDDSRASGWANNYRTDVNVNPNPTLRPSDFLYGLAVADTNDLRGVEWMDVFNPGASNEFFGAKKFNFDYPDAPILHLAEMLLIRAECLGRLDQNLTQAEMDINAIRNRAGLSDITLSSGSEAAAFAIAERRIELCFEGERVHVLKRMGVLGEIDEIRGAPWDCPGMVLQFPNSEITFPSFVLNPEGGCN
ncbi:MAG: hypothetical protein SchgKO_04680 [Schleiferiaceae bacterium]